jgi:ABC-type enterobactin transport system permease subunit
MYKYLILVGDILLLTDALLTVIAHRFWGEGSLVDKKWYNLANFMTSIIIIVNQARPLFDVFFIRVFRVFLLL